MKKEIVLSICDKTGNMVLPWAEAGYLCICIDIQHSIRATRAGRHEVKRFPSGGEIHFMYGDARSWKPSMFSTHFRDKYEIVFVSCFPTCTNLAGSGAQDWQLKGLAMLNDGLALFNSCEQIADWSGAPYICEKPVGTIPAHHRKPDYYFQPWMYGDLWTKKTCLWAGNGFVMPTPLYTKEPAGVTPKIWLASPGVDRANMGSETPMGFATAVFVANSGKKVN